MNPKAQAMLKALFSLSGREEELLRFLPTTLAKEIQSLRLALPFNPFTLLSPYYWSQHIHYSWFSDTLKEYPHKIQSLFLGALTQGQAEGIERMLSLPKIESTPSPFLHPFLMNVLRESLQEPDLLSEQHLPDSPLNCLLQLKQKYLIHLADLLGLYDLAADLRQVVDKGLLDKIYKVFTPDKLEFLHYCSKQPLKWVPPKLGLPSWDGSKKQLSHLLHYRGLIRLAKAIAQEHPSFKWHLMHHCDTGRAKIIQKELYHKQEPTLLPYFKQQVLHIANRYIQQ